MTKIMQTLHRWGPLDLSEINHRLERAFDASSDSLKRNIQNDLKFLRDEGEIVTYYYDKFGNFISSELPPTGDSFYRIKWQTRENEHYQLSGLKELEQFKGSLLFNEEALTRIEIRQGIAKTDPAKRILYFELNHEMYHLSIQAPARDDQRKLFFEVGIGRLGNDTFAQYQWPDDQNTPKAVLTLQDPFLSTLDNPMAPPISLRFYTNGTIDLLDHSNKNKPQSAEISQTHLQKILTDLTFFRDQTKTKHWTDTQNSREEFETFEGSRQALKAPLVIRVQERSGFILD